MTKLSKRGYVEGRPKRYTDPKLMQKKIDKYFNECDKKNEKAKKTTEIDLEPYTVSGLCLALDVNKSTLWDYEQTDQFSDTIKRAKSRIENWIEKKAMTNAINPTVAIFNLKNNFGWVDRREVETTDKTSNAIEEWVKNNANKLKDITPKIKTIEQ